ncbi:TonB-dependent receptor [Candidatus Koribacter versatilis Ellin345]|uniref:TonB-dependent receptor n=1 Tax=Koribacter versatilis (strain Ellin345) TaxID=204669 RepID=Q1INW6_KORVE|nr:TonB-dependent receptor [Candidatus Koribacter versatilis]ABF41434.1 TonB-dependent receptor [Candidatus Koribacter versatilis Ellin345]
MRFGLIATLLWSCLFPALACAQNAEITGHVVDTQGRPIAGAAVFLAERNLRTATDATGHFTFAAESSTPAEVRVEVPGFAPQTAQVTPGNDAEIALVPATVAQNISVTATRSSLSEDVTASSVRVLPSEQLADTAAITLDDKLRQVPGFELFRRSSSRVSNPTSQGVSLRGLGSTAASRTLVLADLIPVNDPFGGWIHWDETPQLLVQQVEVVRGGGSDLYGSSAIGGVMDIVEHPPTLAAGQLDLGYGQQNTPTSSLIESLSHGEWHGLFAGDFVRTDGYTLIAPDQRGEVDTPSNVHYQNANAQIERTFGSRGSAFLDGNFLNEARSNGTFVQNNATRLWRYSTGLDWAVTNTSSFKLRAFGATEHYRQSFSSVAPDRDSETLTRLQHVPTGELGFNGQWLQSFGAHFTLLAGADFLDVRAMDYEQTFFGHPTGYIDTTGRQRDTGVYGEGIFQYNNWTITGSLRFDHFVNLDAQQWIRAKGALTTTPIADRTENVPDPRLGVVRRLTNNIALTATAFRAFRSPTMNELYRTGQVGQQITIANPQLRSERATGWEAGVQIAAPSRNTAVRASYFWTEVNRPVVAVTQSVNGNSITLLRENAGQIRSRGLALDGDWMLRPWLFFSGGYQYADASVTRFDQTPALIGNWIPQVPHNTGTVQATLNKKQFGTLSIQVRGSGQQFDDDRNTFLLHSFFRTDLFAAHDFGRHFQVFLSTENLFDRTIEVGRTPVLTLGTPRLVQGGLKIFWANADRS